MSSNVRERSEGGKGSQVTLDYRPNGEIAGVYADGWLLHNPKIKPKMTCAACKRKAVCDFFHFFECEEGATAELRTVIVKNCTAAALRVRRGDRLRATVANTTPQ